MLSPTDLHEEALFLSTAQPVTLHMSIFPSSAGLPNSTHHETVRTATSGLCEPMLRQRTSLDKRESEVVRTRMRPLCRLELVWRVCEVSVNGTTTTFGASGNGRRVGASMVGEERVRQVFANALRDVFCQ